MAGQTPSTEQFEAYFQRADVDRDGRVSGNEAVAFLQASNLPRQVLAQIWMYADQNHVGFLGRSEFYNCLKLVTVAQSKKELTPDLVKAALYGPASARIPPPQINLAATVGSQSNSMTAPSLVQLPSTSTSTQGIGQSSHHGFESQPGVPAQGMASAGSMSVSPRPSNSFVSLGGVTDAAQAKLYSHVPNRSSIPSATQGDISLITSPITQTKAPENTGLQSALSKPNDTSLVSSQSGKADFKSLSATGNSFGSESVSGDVISTTSSKAQNIPSAVTFPGDNITASLTNLISSREQTTVNPSAVSQPPSVQAHHFQSVGRANQNMPTQKSSAYPAASGQSQPPWPKMTQSDLQKYRKVFVQVDTDRDGKITGDQARNLFLSWRLPREVLKQVWDLSDQDNDSMLSLREFCIALYLMERHREGSPLPKVLPNAAMFDDTLLPASGPPAAVQGNASWRPSGFQELQGAKNAWSITSGGVGKPPHPAPVPQPDEPIQRQAKVPILEKHLLNQLSTGEQESLDRKFEEAKDAEKKVSDLEKDISEAKQKIQFYHSKMQELILYKSRCDNRLNEISEKVIGDKKEAESLANKYEEKYQRIGDVASKLSIEEATFRDIQAKKMELYRAIVKLEQDNADGVQDQANQIQIDLEELVKALNEQCKTYGLRGKPTSLVELPFGWQIGIEAAAADWDEVWDKFEDEGFAYVKEHTLEVQNVIAPPKQKSALIRVHTTSLNTHMSDNTSDLPEQTSPPDSPLGNKMVDSPSKQTQDLRTRDFNMNGSPHAFDTQSEYGAESVLSGGKRFDESDWGSFDTHYDTVAAWDLPKEAEYERHSEASSFGPDDWGLNPIRTGVTKQGPFFDSVPSTPNQAPFFDSVPSTPKQGPFFDSVPSTPQYNFSSSPRIDNNLFTTNSTFADSVPSTPMYSSNTSPRRISEGSEEQFPVSSFSRFDSFNMQDSGPFGGGESFTRFDSMKSSADFEQGFDSRGSLARFDSFRSTADSDYNFGGVFPPSDSSEYGQGFQSFDDGADPFGSGEPFRTTQTPKEDSDHWRRF